MPLAIIVIVLLAAWLMHDREPRYQGQTLTKWLVVYALTPVRTDGQGTLDSSNAVKQIGAQAIPFLLKKLRARDNVVKKHLKALVQSQALVEVKFTSPDLEHFLGFQGFKILGKDALTAVPALKALAQNPDHRIRFRALESLEAIQPDMAFSLPILLAMFNDADAGSRRESAILLRNLYPDEAEKAGVYKTFPILDPSNTSFTNTQPKARYGFPPP
jgi:HEAT repeat protein